MKCHDAVESVTCNLRPRANQILTVDDPKVQKDIDDVEDEVEQLANGPTPKTRRASQVDTRLTNTKLEAETLMTEMDSLMAQFRSVISPCGACDSTGGDDDDDISKECK